MKVSEIKYLIMDVDGSLTDGKVYMGAAGEAMKAFSIKDGYAFNYILKPNNIVPVILTARKSAIVQNRCEELGIKEVYQGKSDKLDALMKIIGKENFGSCSYFGDDLVDLKCMTSIKNAGGIIGCPADASQEIKATADYVCISRAGEGALREFAEWLVNPQIDLEEIRRKIDFAVAYLKNVAVLESDVGKRVRVNENFYYTVQGYMTKPENAVKLESHRKYVDIQIVVSGEEAMDLVDVSRLTMKEEYDVEKDVIYWHIPQRMARITLRTGDCVVLYPENAHRGSIINDNKCQKVIKIVGKMEL